MKQKLLNLYFRFFWILAKVYIKRQKPFIVWITWSVWKTSCRMIISEILEKNLRNKKVYTSQKNFNWELWLSLSILWISDYQPKLISVIKTILNSLKVSLFWKKLYDIIVLEYWINHIWEMDFLLSIVKPNIWIVTKIDKVHSSQFETKETIASEKYKLLKNSQDISFLNFSDEFAPIYEKEINSLKFFYSTDNFKKNKNIDLLWLNYKLENKKNWVKSSFDFYFENKKRFNITSNLIWQENIWYINIWFCILDYLFNKYYKKSYFVKWVGKISQNFTLQYSRFSIFKWIKDSILVDSSYNAWPESMKKVISNFIYLQKNVFSDFEIILCLWEMRELWNYTQNEHENLALFTKDITKNIFVVWNSMKDYFLPVNKNAQYFKNSKLLWEYLRDFISQNTDKKYLILFKWSQNTIFMEEALKEILKNKSDTKKICRQEDFWIEKKEKFWYNNK